MAKNTSKSFQGSLNQSSGRYYLRLTRNGKRDSIPLRRAGQDQATTNRETAVVLAERICKDLKKTKPEAATVGQVKTLYLDHAEAYYSPSEYTRQAWALTYLNPYTALMPGGFGPLRLKLFMRDMVAAGCRRGSINQSAKTVVRMFKWAASEELIAPEIWRNLEAVEPLKKGRAVRLADKTLRIPEEPREVTAVPWEDVEAVLPCMSDVVADMVRLQWWTAMRGGEICIMRPADIDRTQNIWIYNPQQYKTQWREGRDIEIVPIGPRAQVILTKYLFRPADQYCFCPAEATAQIRTRRTAGRKTPLSCGNRGGTNRKGTQVFRPCYNSNSYRRAVRYAIDAVNKHRDKDHKIPVWTPHQLRHAAASRIYEELGKEQARLLLRHTAEAMTENYTKAAEIARRIEAAGKVG
jgi:integrase